MTFDAEEGRILPDLSIGAELDSAQSLKSNKDISNPGVKLHGAGFVVTPDKARTLGLGRIEGIENHIRVYRNGLDLTGKLRGVMVIDLYGLTTSQVLERFPEVYQHVVETVKPERDENKRASRRDNWWLFGETNPKLRSMLKGLPRYNHQQ